LVSAAAAVVIVTAVGCEREREDVRTLEPRLREEFGRDVAFREVRPVIERDVIILEGTVADEGLRTRAEQTAARVAPGRKIENRIMVVKVGEPRVIEGGRGAGENLKELFGAGMDYVRNLNVYRQDGKIIVEGLVADEATSTRADTAIRDLTRDRNLGDYENRIRVGAE
jgi:osmotically-inducible protein OsmY